MHHLPTRASTRFLLLFLLCAACSYWNACKQNDKAPPAQPPAAQAPQEEEVLYAGHSITDSVGEIADRKAHYDTLLQLLNDPFRGKDELGPAHKRIGHYGIDISHYQRDIRWEQVMADSVPHPVRFVFVKATQGKAMVDARFKQNWEQAQKHRFRIGAYHFYKYKDDPLEQAANYIRTVPLTKGHLLPIIDVELDCTTCTAPGIPTDLMIANLKKYVAAIEQHYQVKPIIYTYQGFYHQYLRNHFPEHYYWMALYRNKPPEGWVEQVKKEPTNEPKIALWQFTDSGKVPGITGAVDMSFLIGKYEKNVIIR